MKNIFSIKLYKEALRQLKIPASLFLGIMIGLSGIMTVANIASAMYDYKRSHYITTIDFGEALIFLPLIFAIAVPLFVFKLFGFLTKRNASDFYHAIPHSRTCIFVSYTAAILSISTLFVILGTLIPCIAYSTSGTFISFNATYAIHYAVNVLACIILCLGILLLSSSLTGTFFTNILFALGIMFIPRFIITITTETLTSVHSEILPYDASFGIFSSNMNVIWSHINGIFLFGEFSDNSFMMSGPTLYTFVLGLIYMALGFLAFRKRKSEQAESSAQNPIAHNIIRCGIGFVFIMFIILLEYEADIDTFIEIGLLAFLAVFGMIIFEIITTKKVKRILNVIASIPVVILLGVIYHFTLELAGNSIISYKPDADSIKYIQFSPSSSMNDNYDYFNYVSSKVKFDDKELIKLLANAYNNHLETYINHKENYDLSYQYYNNLNEETTVITVRFKEGLSSKERNLYLTAAQLQEFNEMVSSNEDYLNAFRSLPENLNVEWGGEFFNGGELKKIIAEYEKDLKNMDASMLTASLSSYHTRFADSIITLEASTVTNVGELYISLNVSTDTPNAYAATTKILASKVESEEEKKEITKICEAATNLEKYNNDYSGLYLSFKVFDLKTNTITANMNFNEYTASEFVYEDSFESGAYGSYEELTAALEKFLTNTASPESADYVVFVECTGSISDESFSNTEFIEYYSVFYTNDIDTIEYLEAEEYYSEYYGEEKYVY